MKKRTIILFIIIGLCVVTCSVFLLFKKKNVFINHTIGDAIDSLNGVKVYYNGSIGNVSGRNLSEDGYNLGLKYQCVEFVKRYYYEYLNHKMPDSYGHAKDFFDNTLKDGMKNKQRNLIQYSNPSKTKPNENDLLVFSETQGNPYGHVAIVSEVLEDKIEVIQQNPGKQGESRIYISINQENNKWKINNDRILGWLRKE